MGNILQNSPDVTYEDFLKGVFGVKSKPERNALKTLFSEIVTGKSTLVSDRKCFSPNVFGGSREKPG